MPRVRPLEVKAILPLLEQDWDSREGMAAAIIQAIDEARASRTSWIGVVQFKGNSPVYVGIGPYPTRASALRALASHPVVSDSLVAGRAVVPVESPLGLERRVKALDSA